MTGTTLIALLLAGGVALDGEAIPLPAPTGLDLSLREALRQRRSTRRFDQTRRPSREQLGALLWAAVGVNRPDPDHPQGGKRTAPSAFGAGAVDLVVTSSDGTFRYSPKAHALIPLDGGDLRQKLTGAAWAREAPLLVVLVADLARYPERVSGEDRQRYASADAAVIGQNLYLAAEALGLGTVLTASADRRAGELLGLEKDERVVFVFPVGYERKEPTVGTAPEERGGPAVCTVLADARLTEPLSAIAGEYRRRTGSRIALRFQPASQVNALVEGRAGGYDAALSLPVDADTATSVGTVRGARTVAWKYPSGEPVWAAPLTDHPEASRLLRFAGGPTGHRLWSESEAGFTIIADTSARAYEWVVEHRTQHTYPMTAMRMLRECGGMREGVCIDVGCGPGHLEIELARRSDFAIIGLDIDPGVKPLFEKRMRAAGLADRVSFVLGDAQSMPFPDDYADLIVSRGALIFVPDIGKCLREVRRVLKPTGVAFLGGRYLYAPRTHRIPTEKLRKIVEASGVSDAQVIADRGQWVKIVGAQAPEAARQFQGGPGQLAGRCVADYSITRGKSLLLCGTDGNHQQSLQRGFVNLTELDIVALYSSGKIAGEARERIQAAGLAGRIECEAGTIDALPFAEGSFDLVVGAGPFLIFAKDRERAMRELYRVLRPGGVALVGGRYLHMPPSRRVSTASLRRIAAGTRLASIRVLDDMGQWVEIRRGLSERDLAPPYGSQE